MERRFKLGVVSFHEVINYGDNFKLALDQSLPEGVQCLMTRQDFEYARVECILYCEEWEIVPINTKLEIEFEIEIKKPKKLEYNH